jgi:hypothetical protein
VSNARRSNVLEKKQNDLLRFQFITIPVVPGLIKKFPFTNVLIRCHQKRKKKWNQATFRNVHTYSIGGMNFDVSFSSFQVRRNSVSQRITITHFTFEMLPPIIPPFLPPPTKKKSPTNFPLPFRVGAFCLCLFEKSKLSKRGPKTWNSH